MPGPHHRFLEHVSNVANIREYVESHRSNRGLCIAYNACLAMLRTFRDKHIQMVSRYIIIQSRESRSQQTLSVSPRAAPQQPAMLSPTRTVIDGGKTGSNPSTTNNNNNNKKKLRGTGGTALIPFLKQARDETGEPAIDAWARRLLSGGAITGSNYRSTNKIDDDEDVFSTSFGSLRLGSSPAASAKEKADERRSSTTTTNTNNTNKKAEVEIVGLAGNWTMDDSEGGLCHW